MEKVGVGPDQRLMGSGRLGGLGLTGLVMGLMHSTEVACYVLRIWAVKMQARCTARQ